MGQRSDLLFKVDSEQTMDKLSDARKRRGYTGGGWVS